MLKSPSHDQNPNRNPKYGFATITRLSHSSNNLFSKRSKAWVVWPCANAASGRRWVLELCWCPRPRHEDQLTVILYSLTVKKPDGSKANISVSCVLLICASTYWETKPTDEEELKITGYGWSQCRNDRLVFTWLHLSFFPPPLILSQIKL